MKLSLFQRYYINCLLSYNKDLNYIRAKDLFEKRFNDINFVINEDNFRKIKNSLLGVVNNKNIEEICNLIKNNNPDIIVDIYPINTEFKNKNNKLEKREQKVIVIGKSDMIRYLNSDLSTQYGLDCTYKIIPRSLKPYKLLSIYSIDKINNKSVIAALICIKYVDYVSLKKLFSILNAAYYFSPVCVTTDFSFPQIKALRDCHSFKKKPYIICCIFHFSQIILKKLKEFKIIKKKLNKKGYEILRNLEI